MRGKDERALGLAFDLRSAEPGSATGLLVEFALHPNVEPVHFGGDLEPSAVIGPLDGDRTVVRVGSDRLASVPVTGAGILAQAEPCPEGGVEVAKERLMKAVAAHALRSDALVTDDPYLLQREYDPEKGLAPVLSVRQGLALIGLFLRRRGDYTSLMRSGSRCSLGADHFYWILARDLVPATWPWFSACVHSEHETDLVGIGQSCMVRFVRALRSRDHLFEKLFLLGSGAIGDEVLYFLDSLLLQLVGAFDVLARVLHSVYELRGSTRGASWRKRGWLDSLATSSPEQAALLQEGTDTREVVDLLYTVRNTIHGRTLGEIQCSRSQRYRFQISEPDAAGVRESLRFGVHAGDYWGLTESNGDGLWFDVGTFVEAMIPAAAGALNRMMGMTDLESFPRVRKDKLLYQAPTDGIFEPELRRSACLTAGLEPDPSVKHTEASGPR